MDDAQRFNDIEVAEDGTIWATQTGTEEERHLARVPHRTGRRLVGRRRGSAARPAQRRSPSTPDGNIVVVNINDNAVLTFSPDGELVGTEHSGGTAATTGW